MKSIHILTSALVVLSATAHAQTQAPATPSQSVASTLMTEGEVRKVDKEAGKLTLRHGPIQSLGMPGMTMVFKVSDPAMLDTVREGDKVRFTADRFNGAITVTKLEASK